MKLEDFVTFAGPSRLDRDMDKRSDERIIETLIHQKESRLLLFWQGMPLVDQQSKLVFLVPSSQLVASLGTRVFLGTCEGTDYFAVDISGKHTPLTSNVVEDRLFDQKKYQHPDFPDYDFQNLRMLLPSIKDSLMAELLATGKALLGWHSMHKFCSFCSSPSNIANAGWSRVCPACQTEHFPRCDPVVIMLILRQNRLLLGRSYHWPRGMHSLLAGFMEPGESIAAAVRREVFEESKIIVDKISFVASQPWPFPTSLMIGCQGEALTEEIKPQKKEIENALWLEREEVMAIYGGTRHDISLPRKGSIAEFLIRKWLAGELL